MSTNYLTYNTDFRINDPYKLILSNTGDITTVSGSGVLQVSGGATIDKQLSVGGDLTLAKNIKTKQKYPKFPSNVLTYLDFSNQEDIAYDISDNHYKCINYSTSYTDTLVSRDNSTAFTQTAGSTGDYIQRIELLNDAYTLLRDFTISLWINVTLPLAANCTIISFSNSTINNSYVSITIDTSGYMYFSISINNIVSFVVKSTNTLTSATWAHVVVSAGNSGNYMYIDNTLQTNYTTGSNSITHSIDSINSTHSLVGGINNNSTYSGGFKGNVADLLITNDRLDSTTIGELYVDNYGYEVVALMGQSNMVGRATINVGIDDDYTIISGKVYQYPYDVNNPSADGVTFGSTISAATNPLDFISNISGGSSGELSGKMGLWKTFTETLINNGSLPIRRKILLVPIAKGGTGFSTGEWNSGNPIYTAAKNALNAALGTFSMNSLSSILWLQGENDADSLNYNFENNLTSMYNTLILDIPSAENIPFIIATIRGSSVGSTAVTMINNHLYSFATNENKFIISTNDLTLIDTYHFDSSSQRTIGIRMANAFLYNANTVNFNKSTAFEDKIITRESIIINNITDATSSIDGGTLTTYGGAAIGKQLFIGTNLSIGGVIDTASTIDITSTSALLVRKNNNAGNIFVVDTTNDVVKVGYGSAPTNTGRLSVYGLDSSATENASLVFVTSGDVYPTFQLLNYRHDTVALNFDMYYDSIWKSSDPGSNFQIIKTSDILKFNYNSGITAGTDTSSILTKTAISISNSGTVNIASKVNKTLKSIAPSEGDIIEEVSFSIANNQASAANVTGLAFSNTTVRSFKALVAVTIDATADLFAQVELQGVHKTSSWVLTSNEVGDSSGIVFSITSSGQVQYTSANYTGFVSGTIKFKANTIGI